MKLPWMLLLSVALLSGCQAGQSYTDNGSPGHIKATVFHDNNRNGVMDSDEAGAPVDVGISQPNSCPGSTFPDLTIVRADASGTALFRDLAPGKYCVHPVGPTNATTRLAQEVYVSSDEVATVAFGIVGD